MIEKLHAKNDDIEQQKTNVTVHGVPESDAEDADQRIDNDMMVLATMFQANITPLFKKGKRSQAENYRPVSLTSQVENVTVDSVVRLGKKAADPTQNPRPMKVVLDSVESKVSLLKKAKNLREKEEGGWSKVFIHQDLTLKQREA